MAAGMNGAEESQVFRPCSLTARKQQDFKASKAEYIPTAILANWPNGGGVIKQLYHSILYFCFALLITSIAVKTLCLTRAF